MIAVSEPLPFVAIGFASMLLCGWLFDRAHRRCMPNRESGEQVAARAPRLVPVLVNLAVALAMLLALYGTSLNVADLVLIAALIAFAHTVYRVRLRPLLDAGLSGAHLAGLALTAVLWALPMLWAIHLHLASRYGAA